MAHEEDPTQGLQRAPIPSRPWAAQPKGPSWELTYQQVLGQGAHHLLVSARTAPSDPRPNLCLNLSSQLIQGQHELPATNHLRKWHCPRLKIHPSCTGQGTWSIWWGASKISPTHSPWPDTAGSWCSCEPYPGIKDCPNYARQWAKVWSNKQYAPVTTCDHLLVCLHLNNQGFPLQQTKIVTTQMNKKHIRNRTTSLLKQEWKVPRPPQASPLHFHSLTQAQLVSNQCPPRLVSNPKYQIVATDVNILPHLLSGNTCNENSVNREQASKITQYLHYIM